MTAVGAPEQPGDRHLQFERTYFAAHSWQSTSNSSRNRNTMFAGAPLSSTAGVAPAIAEYNITGATRLDDGSNFPRTRVRRLLLSQVGHGNVIGIRINGLTVHPREDRLQSSIGVEGAYCTSESVLYDCFGVKPRQTGNAIAAFVGLVSYSTGRPATSFDALGTVDAILDESGTLAARIIIGVGKLLLEDPYPACVLRAVVASAARHKARGPGDQLAVCGRYFSRYFGD